MILSRAQEHRCKAFATLVLPLINRLHDRDQRDALCALAALQADAPAGSRALRMIHLQGGLDVVAAVKSRRGRSCLRGALAAIWP